MITRMTSAINRTETHRTYATPAVDNGSAIFTVKTKNDVATGAKRWKWILPVHFTVPNKKGAVAPFLRGGKTMNYS